MVASVALETDSVDLERDSFTCTGSMQVQDWNISCADHNGHGTQTFAEAVRNSCNPAFIQIGRKIGGDKFLAGMRADYRSERRGQRREAV